MLAKTPKPSAIDFSEVLKIPQKPDSIAAAERKWREAVADREAAQAKHAALHRIYFGQRPGEPCSVTASQLDEAGKEIEPFQVEERKTLQALEAEREAFDAELTSLGPKIEAYRNAIADKLDELEDLIGIGVHFHAASVEAKCKLPSRLPGRCAAMISHGVSMTRKLLNGA